MPTPTTPDQPADANARRQRAATEARRAAVRVWVARTRAAQGLPRHVQDPEVIAGLVMLFRPTPGDHAYAHHHSDGDDLPEAAGPPATRAADRSAD